MSLVGQNQPWRPRSATSGLPLTTDIIRPARLVRFVAQADPCTAAKARLVDHLVGDGQHPRRERDPESPGSLEVDNELERGWLHYR